MSRCDDLTVLCWIEAHPGLAGYVQAIGSIAAILAAAWLARYQVNQAKVIEWRRERIFLERVGDTLGRLFSDGRDSIDVFHVSDSRTEIIKSFRFQNPLLELRRKGLIERLALGHDQLVIVSEDIFSWPSLTVQRELHAPIHLSDRIVKNALCLTTLNFDGDNDPGDDNSILAIAKAVVADLSQLVKRCEELRTKINHEIDDLS